MMYMMLVSLSWASQEELKNEREPVKRSHSVRNLLLKVQPLKRSDSIKKLVRQNPVDLSQVVNKIIAWEQNGPADEHGKPTLQDLQAVLLSEKIFSVLIKNIPENKILNYKILRDVVNRQQSPVKKRDNGRYAFFRTTSERDLPLVLELFPVQQTA